MKISKGHTPTVALSTAHDPNRAFAQAADAPPLQDKAGHDFYPQSRYTAPVPEVPLPRREKPFEFERPAPPVDKVEIPDEEAAAPVAGANKGGKPSGQEIPEEDEEDEGEGGGTFSSGGDIYPPELEDHNFDLLNKEAGTYRPGQDPGTGQAPGSKDPSAGKPAPMV